MQKQNALLGKSHLISPLFKSAQQSTPRRDFSFAYPCPRKLREIMKMSAIEKEPTKVIETIWNTYH